MGFIISKLSKTVKTSECIDQWIHFRLWRRGKSSSLQKRIPWGIRKTDYCTCYVVPTRDSRDRKKNGSQGKRQYKYTIDNILLTRHDHNLISSPTITMYASAGEVFYDVNLKLSKEKYEYIKNWFKVLVSICQHDVEDKEAYVDLQRLKVSKFNYRKELTVSKFKN